MTTPSDYCPEHAPLWEAWPRAADARFAPIEWCDGYRVESNSWCGMLRKEEHAPSTLGRIGAFVRTLLARMGAPLILQTRPLLAALDALLSSGAVCDRCKGRKTVTCGQCSGIGKTPGCDCPGCPGQHDCDYCDVDGFYDCPLCAGTGLGRIFCELRPLGAFLQPAPLAEALRFFGETVTIAYVDHEALVVTSDDRVYVQMPVRASDEHVVVAIDLAATPTSAAAPAGGVP